MKILFIGDYSGLHATLGEELARRGFSVTVVSDAGKHMHTEAHHIIRRQSGFSGGVKYLFDLMHLLPELKGYDVVQIINPLFFSLRPGKNAYFFRQLKSRNSKICLTLAGNDYCFVDECINGDKFRYSQFRIGHNQTPWSIQNREAEKQWQSPSMRDYEQYIYDNIDGAMSALYEYHAAALPKLGERLSYTGIPIDTEKIKESDDARDDESVNLFIGSVRGREIEKGTDVLTDIAYELESAMPQKCRVIEVSNLPFGEYMRQLRKADIVLDQLYSYSPATNALGAMAMGKVAASGAQEEYYDFIGEEMMRPVISLYPDKEAVRADLERHILNRDLIRAKKDISRAFVIKHNSARVVADRYIRHWESL